LFSPKKVYEKQANQANQATQGQIFFLKKKVNKSLGALGVWVATLFINFFHNPTFKIRTKAFLVFSKKSL